MKEDPDIESVSLEDAEPQDDTAVAAGLAPKPEDEEPEWDSPGWNDFAMKHFENNEVDPNGRPFVAGLRRVTELLLGPVLESTPRVVQSPAYEGEAIIRPAVVEYTIRVYVNKRPGLDPHERVVGDAADVSAINCDPFFARFPTAVATTRAEARCFRKLLKLRTISAEEGTDVPLPDSNPDGKVTRTQVTFMNVLCRRANVNGLKFINAGKSGTKYKSVWDVMHPAAEKMMKVLSGFTTDLTTVPEKLKGYDENWLN